MNDHYKQPHARRPLKHEWQIGISWSAWVLTGLTFLALLVCYLYLGQSASATQSPLPTPTTTPTGFVSTPTPIVHRIYMPMMGAAK